MDIGIRGCAHDDLARHARPLAELAVDLRAACAPQVRTEQRKYDEGRERDGDEEDLPSVSLVLPFVAMRPEAIREA